MTNPFSWLKNHLSHVKSTSWHFKVVEWTWGKKTYGNACAYYWVKLPLALLLPPFLFVIVVVIIGGISLFFGRIITYFEPKDETRKILVRGDPWYGYKETPNGNNFLVAPWEVVTVLTVLYGLYYLAVVDQELGKNIVLWVGVVVAIIAAIVTIGFAIWKLFHSQITSIAFSSLGDTWDNVCPPLVVDEEKS